MPVSPPFGLGLGSGSGSGSAAVPSGSTDPPPSSAPPAPPPADVPAAPSTSLQHTLHVARQLERSRRDAHTPDHRRTPFPHPLPGGNPWQPPTSDGQFGHLPAHLAAQLAALPPLPPPAHQRRSRLSHAPPAPSVSLYF
jgi:hypothetical protein